MEESPLLPEAGLTSLVTTVWKTIYRKLWFALMRHQERFCGIAGTVISSATSSTTVTASVRLAWILQPAMSISRPGIGEWEIQASIESHFTMCRSTNSYNPIVGGGDNSTILHYSSNSDNILGTDLVLVDAGCEVNGYASDITRTWPVSGMFSEAQREIYELVLRAELSAIEACQVGSPWENMHRAASEVLARGLIDLGILQCSYEDAIGDNLDGDYRKFFMHGTGHMLGLDVHDVGGGRQGGKKGPILKSGMIVTIEPGLYFASWRDDISVPEKYSGIGVRIEDDVLITEDGPVVLTEMCPKTIDEIESIVGSAL